MRPFLLTCAAALLTFAVVTTANANEFVAGSAKTEATLTIANLGEHASFSVHTRSGPVFCAASGQIVYKADASPFASGGPLQFQAKLEELTIFPVPQETFAAFAGTITSVKQGPPSFVGQHVIFSALDSGMPGGAGDQFALNQITPTSQSTCSSPIFVHPIDQGNIVIKTTP